MSLRNAIMAGLGLVGVALLVLVALDGFTNGAQTCIEHGMFC